MCAEIFGGEKCRYSSTLARKETRNGGRRAVLRLSHRDVFSVWRSFSTDLAAFGYFAPTREGIFSLTVRTRIEVIIARGEPGTLSRIGF